MNRALVYSDDGRARTWFQRLASAKDYEVQWFPNEEWIHAVSFAAETDLVWIEVGDWKDPARRKALDTLKTWPAGTWAVLDPAGPDPDPAQWFLAGAADWLGPGLLTGPLPLSRLRQPFERRAENQCEDTASSPAAGPVLATGPFHWDRVVEGQTYPFYFLLVAADQLPTLKKRLGDSRYQAWRRDWAAWWSAQAQTHGGRLWMDGDGVLLLLFPRTEDQCPAFELGLRFLLQQKRLSFEQFNLELDFSARLALLAGETPWTPLGQTGQVVSDAVNSVFHLGLKATPGASFCFDANLGHLVPLGLEDLVKDQGLFEGRPISVFSRFR